jgi:hypothetical protein
MPRRATDRVEDLTAWLLVTAALLLMVLAGVAAAAVYRDGVRRSGIEAAERHQVSAEVVGRPNGMAARYPIGTARWSTPEGTPRIGRVPMTAVRPAGGGTTQIWVDAAGAPSRPPTTPAQAVQAAAVTAVAVCLAGLALLAGAWAGVRSLVARCNAARWEREWARVGPRWSRRVH